MEQAKVILIKFIVSLIAFSIGLDLFFDATLTDIISFGVTVTAVSYILADRILLPRIGSTNTLMAEFILTYMIVWIFGAILLHGYLQIAWGSAISAIIITAAEVYVHRYLLKHLPERKREIRHHGATPKLRFVTEFAEDDDPTRKK
ncbi:YndM family protein [Fictibacillus sp. KIGAM418]|uniref:YndM family protein n=1 Tax=Fictibacillus marinisediminis TaxID=2878389 RepID=A0A9X2BD14_9BACL|nr:MULTISPECIES: YndM family protein [Fictibacillus]MCK6256210.1 YndM family protein [Fictibacillus marinisediminis]MED2974471.1 YndM family protein [Fictibacillus sp. B-59209]